MLFKNQLKAYLPFVFTSYILGIFVRLIEFVGVTFFYKFHTPWLGYESLGLLFDFTLINLVLLLYFPIFCLINQRYGRLTRILTLVAITLVTVGHIVVSGYFIKQLTPLDVFIYRYPFEEIYFTITTANVPFVPVFVALLILLAVPLFIYLFFKRKKYNAVSLNVIIGIIVISSISSVVNFQIPDSDEAPFYENKSFFFLTNSIQYFVEQNKKIPPLTKEDVVFFQSLYPSKKFISNAYPLLYERNKSNELFNLLEPFDTKPNIVYIIVEGFNDSYLHNYHGLKLMPYLSELITKSLYWENCFTLGERSFAVIGNSLGGLPYGDLGFTLLENYPKHHSLVNLLSSKGYYTAFYTGQAAWFHQNGPFFEYNHANKVFDNFTFGEKYKSKQIIVGDDKKFFWGFNDKDLFNFSLENMDTLQHNPYFITYFTGSTHSPFAISNEKYYLDKINQLKTPQTKEFIETYKKYLKSIPFLDDAIKEFMESYQKRSDYKNTIFVITGDHPMTELPRDGELKKYHVPMIIYTPKLKEAKVYSHVVSHLDLQATLLDFMENYSTKFSNTSTSLGYSLFDTQPRKFVFMDGNRDMYEYYSSGYFLRKGQLYKVKANFDISPISNEKLKQELARELANFKVINYHTTKYDKIISNTRYAEGLSKSKLIDKKTTKEIESSEEFVNLLPSQLIENRDLNIELNINFQKGMGKEVSVVYELKDEKDSVLVWKNNGLDRIRNFQLYQQVKKQQKLGKNKLAIYIWNPKRTEIRFNHVSILVY
jgi:uncharacterized sulfatase